jgi:DNA processing protein
VPAEGGGGVTGVEAAASSSTAARLGVVQASERDAWVALSTLAGVGPATFSQLIRRHGSASAAWRASEDGPDAAGGAAAVSGAGPRGDAGAVARAVETATRRAGGRVVTSLDDAYPPALLTLDPRPPTLYVAGAVSAFRERGVAIVGTRRASSYGLSAAAEVADELARAGVVVISGLALGIDGAAHRAAVAAGGRTIAVLPSALDRIYPPRHRGLASEIVSSGGALVTEVPAGSALGRPDFARRNRIIAGLAEAVVVVEAPDRSGALLTAAAAVATGRELYAVPGPIGSMASRGCNRLIADHEATIVTSSASLLRQIGLSRGRETPAVAALSEVEGQVLRRLLERSGSIEELVDRTSQPPAAVASALTMLEARGLADPFGGATFHPTTAARRLAEVP